MLSGTPLRAALSDAPLVSFTGFVTRFVDERYRRMAMPEGAYKRGGRYNQPGTRAIYTSPSRVCAFREFTDDYEDDQPMSASAMLSLHVRLSRVLDLCSGDICKTLATTHAELCAPLFTFTHDPTQVLGTTAASFGIDGILAPSRVHAGTNLVIFPDVHTDPPYRVIVRIGRGGA